MVRISDLNKREREVRKSLNDLEKQLKDNKISKDDYSRLRKEKEGELKQIDVDRKIIIDSLPPIPPPPKPTNRVITSKTTSDISDIQSFLKQQEKDLNFTQGELSKLYAEVIKNREKIKSIESLANKVSQASSQAPKINVDDISNKIESKMEAMNNQVKTNLEKNRADIDKMLGDIKSMKMQLDDMKNVHSKLEKMDVSGLRREVESLKQRGNHLEEQISDIDMESVFDMMKEMDRKIANSRVGPVIIE